MQFSPISPHFIPPRYKYSPQHPVLKHPQFLLSRTCQYTNMRSNFTDLCPQRLTQVWWLNHVRRMIQAMRGFSLSSHQAQSFGGEIYFYTPSRAMSWANTRPHSTLMLMQCFCFRMRGSLCQISNYIGQIIYCLKVVIYKKSHVACHVWASESNLHVDKYTEVYNTL
jgi:hypothetical protein